MKKVKGMPITGTNLQMSKKKPLVPDAKNTSANAQTMIAEDPMPFKNRMETPQMPTGTAVKGATPGLGPRIKAGLQHSNPGAKALPSMGPVGQRKPINQSGQIGGKMGYPPPKRKAGQPVPSSYKAKKNASFYGE